MPDTTIDQENGFDAGREREQIMNAGRMLERLAKHWDYIGDLQGRRGTKEYWKVNNGLMKLCGAEWPGDKPDFAENMEGRSMEEMEEVINEALKTLNNYVSRQSTFFGFLARLFNPLANMKMEDADIAIRKLQSIKNSMVRLREHNEPLDIHPEREAEETEEEFGEDNLLKCQNLKPEKRNVKKPMKNRVKDSVRQEELHRDREKKPKKSLFCRQTENSRKSDEQKNESMENNRVK